jgi:hypothetical protein
VENFASDIVESELLNPKFAVVYLAEMQVVMAQTDAGSPALRARALEVLGGQVTA